jgi:hypothetical protein
MPLFLVTYLVGFVLLYGSVREGRDDENYHQQIDSEVDFGLADSGFC